MRKYCCLENQRIEHAPYAIIPVQDEHIEKIRLWRNAQMEILRQEKEISERQQQAYFKSKIWPEMDLAQPSNILMAYLKNDELIGYGGLVHISWKDLRSEISFLTDPIRALDIVSYSDCHIKFLGLIKILAFGQLGFKRLFTETYDIRQQHIENLEASGFLREGVMQAHVRINNRSVDSIIHGCLSNER